MAATSDTEYDIGDQPTFTGTFKDKDAVLTDPATVQFVLRDPAKVETVLAATNPSTGVYVHEATVLDQDGIWTYRFNGTGAGLVTAGEKRINVRKSDFATPLP